MSAAAFDTFDTLQYAKQLKAVDVPERQAELEAEVLGKTLSVRDKVLADLETKVQGLAADSKQTATKEDMTRLKDDVKEDVRGLKEDVIRLEGKIELISKDLLIKLGGGLIASVTIILGAIGLAVRYLSKVT